MYIEQLADILERNRVPKDMYDLGGGLPSEAYCIGFFDGRWEVYYSERGERSEIGSFDDEDDACECLLNELKRYVRIVR